MMVDIVDALTRSRMMAAIKGRNTKPELALRRALHSKGLRYRLHVKGLPGKPDLVFPKFKAAVFVHGCFWHRHAGCRYATSPATRPQFWATKFQQNLSRDRMALTALEVAGWRTGVVWECAIKALGAQQVGEQVEQWLTGHMKTMTIPDELH